MKCINQRNAHERVPILIFKSMFNLWRNWTYDISFSNAVRIDKRAGRTVLAWLSIIVSDFTLDNILVPVNKLTKTGSTGSNATFPIKTASQQSTSLREHFFLSPAAARENVSTSKVDIVTSSPFRIKTSTTTSNGAALKMGWRGPGNSGKGAINLFATHPSFIYKNVTATGVRDLEIGRSGQISTMPGFAVPLAWRPQLRRKQMASEQSGYL
jgi:hypothetical protein